MEIKNTKGEFLMKIPQKTLVEVSLRGANLYGADLSRANLSRANLSRANLSWADLSGANLSRADLSWANLSRADLSGADLSGADLSGADLSWADLRGTCLDPEARPNGDCDGFTKNEMGEVVGYRTPHQPHMKGEKYEPGREYVAPVFSVSETECHPGLYLRPVREEGDITVFTRPEMVHRAGEKWRCKRFRTSTCSS